MSRRAVMARRLVTRLPLIKSQMLSLIDFVYLAAAGGVAGLLGGLLGIGGGIVMIPTLFSLFELWGVPFEQRMHCAVATSLVVIVATNISTVWAHHRRGSVDWSIALYWTPFLLAGSIVGSLTAQSLGGHMLVYAFVCLILVLAIKMILPLGDTRLGTSLPKGLIGAVPPFTFAWVSAILGIGGGSLNVPYMTLYGIVIQRAVATAALGGLFISLAGGATFLISTPTSLIPLSRMVGYVHLPSVLGLAITSVLAAPLGARLAHHMSKRQLTVTFGVFLIVAAVRLLVSLQE